MVTEDEMHKLRQRVSDLEKAVFNLGQRCYALESELRQREIKEYLENKETIKL